MKQRRVNGFTLLEITVTLAIIAAIFTIAAAGFNRINSGSNLTLTTENLISEIRSTALMALNAEQYQLQAPFGWGIDFDTTANTYTIFADLDNDNAYDTNEKYKTVTFSKNIDFGAIYFNSSGWVAGALVFRQSTGIPYFSNTQVTNTTGQVEIQVTDNITSAQKSIWVNFLGTVSL